MERGRISLISRRTKSMRKKPKRDELSTTSGLPGSFSIQGRVDLLRVVEAWYQYARYTKRSHPPKLFFHSSPRFILMKLWKPRLPSLWCC